MINDGKSEGSALIILKIYTICQYSFGCAHIYTRVEACEQEMHAKNAIKCEREDIVERKKGERNLAQFQFSHKTFLTPAGRSPLFIATN